MSERDTTRDDEAQAVIGAIDSTLIFCAAWTLWKSTHDVDSLELNCCEVSKALHAAANKLEKSMRQLVMNEQFLEHVFGKELAVVVKAQAERLTRESLLRDLKSSSKH